MFQDDTIAAISSTVGPAPRMIVRLSGDRTHELARSLAAQFQAARGVARQTTLDFANLSIPAWVYVFTAPHSYTAQDLVEFHLPGNPLLARMLLNELLSRNHKLETRFKALLLRKTEACRLYCQILAAAGRLHAGTAQIDGLVTNMVVITSYWLSFEYIRHARRFSESAFQQAAMARGAQQVLALLAPYLSAEDQVQLVRLIDRQARLPVAQPRAA